MQLDICVDLRPSGSSSARSARSRLPVVSPWRLAIGHSPARNSEWQEEEARQYSEQEDAAYYGLGTRMAAPTNFLVARRPSYAMHFGWLDRPTNFSVLAPPGSQARSVLMASIFYTFSSCSPLILAAPACSFLFFSFLLSFWSDICHSFLPGLHLDLLLPGAVCLWLHAAVLREQEARHRRSLLGPGLAFAARP